ncbi:hypothetical protein CEXT_744341, partial [Caerostris extrusa]
WLQLHRGQMCTSAEEGVGEVQKRKKTEGRGGWKEAGMHAQSTHTHTQHMHSTQHMPHAIYSRIKIQ